jgi:hypothetical protein
MIYATVDPPLSDVAPSTLYPTLALILLLSSIKVWRHN